MLMKSSAWMKILPVSGNVLVNGASADGEPEVMNFTVNNGDCCCSWLQRPSMAEGRLTINSDGSYTFIPNANFNGDGTRCQLYRI